MFMDIIDMGNTKEDNVGYTLIHIDDVIDNYQEEKIKGTEFGLMSLEEYIKYIGTYMKVYSDGE